MELEIMRCPLSKRALIYSYFCNLCIYTSAHMALISSPSSSVSYAAVSPYKWNDYLLINSIKIFMTCVAKHILPFSCCCWRPRHWKRGLRTEHASSSSSSWVNTQELLSVTFQIKTKLSTFALATDKRICKSCSSSSASELIGWTLLVLFICFAPLQDTNRIFPRFVCHRVRQIDCELRLGPTYKSKWTWGRGKGQLRTVFAHTLSSHWDYQEEQQQS